MSCFEPLGHQLHHASGAIAGRYLLDPSAPAADVYFGRGQTILPERERIKRDKIKQRRVSGRVCE